jgi:biotin synthase
MTVPSAIAAAHDNSRLDWNELAAHVLAGYPLSQEAGAAILQSPDDELLEVLAAAYRIRRRYFGNTVQLHFLINAKSGLCTEDCSYCSQSRVSTADIPKYSLIDRDQVLEGARQAHARHARTYCVAISGRSPTERELQAVEEFVPLVKARYPLRMCVSLGLLNRAQADRLKACGVDRVNHNLNTAAEYYDAICTTHTFQDRLDSLRAIRGAGLELCSGGIVGLGESDVDLVHMALELRALRVESIPVNFLNPIDGTPLAGMRRLDPRYCLKALALFRFAAPDQELRIAGGRELHLGSMQALGLYAANSIFVGDYLTTKGQPPEADFRMIQELGFVITPAPAAAGGRSH